MNANDPAFPIEPSLHSGPYSGLTKREYFAGLAMQGILSSWPEDAKYEPEKTAYTTIRFADALIAALSKEESP